MAGSLREKFFQMQQQYGGASKYEEDEEDEGEDDEADEKIEKKKSVEKGKVEEVVEEEDDEDEEGEGDEDEGDGDEEVDDEALDAIGMEGEGEDSDEEFKAGPGPAAMLLPCWCSYGAFAMLMLSFVRLDKSTVVWWHQLVPALGDIIETGDDLPIKDADKLTVCHSFATASQPSYKTPPC
jgi:hypothetical protein